MAEDFEVDVDAWFPFRVVDDSGDGLTGLVAATLSGMKFNQHTQAGTAQTAFTEVDTGAADYEVNEIGEGDYEVMIPGAGGATANNDTEATCWVNGAATGGHLLIEKVKVVDPTAANNIATIASDWLNGGRLDLLLDQAAALLTTALADAYAANGVDPTLQQAIMAIHQWLMDFAIVGASINVEKVDGTAAFAGTLDDPANPTAVGRP